MLSRKRTSFFPAICAKKRYTDKKNHASVINQTKQPKQEIKGTRTPQANDKQHDIMATFPHRSAQATEKHQSASTASSDDNAIPDGNGVYLLQLENFDGTVKAKPLGKSVKLSFIYKFAIYVATREKLGRDWNAKEDGDLFYDPVIDAREPQGEYLRWMSDEEVADMNPEYGNVGAICHGGILHVFDSSKTAQGCRKIKKRYTVYKVQPTIWDLMAAETEGDICLRELQQVPLCITASATAGVKHILDEPSPTAAKYLPPGYMTESNRLRLTNVPDNDETRKTTITVQEEEVTAVEASAVHETDAHPPSQTSRVTEKYDCTIDVFDS